jgi:hypothetical protein
MNLEGPSHKQKQAMYQTAKEWWNKLPENKMEELAQKHLPNTESKLIASIQTYMLAIYLKEMCQPIEQPS